MRHFGKHIRTTGRRRGGWRPFIVGALLLLFACSLLGFFWLATAVYRARVQAHAVKAIRVQGVEVRYDWEHQFQSGYEHRLVPWTEEPSYVRWLPHWLGRDLWHDVTYVGMETLLDGVPLLDFLDEPPSDAQPDNERNGADSHGTESVYTPPADIAHLGAFPRLQSLSLAGPTFGDDAVSHLASFGSLRQVSLSRTNATDESIRMLRQAPRLENLYMKETPITDAGLASMNPNWPLRILDLSDTHVTDAGLGHVAQFEALEYLSLRGTRVADAGLSHLGGLRTLQELDLSNTHVTQHGVEQLQDRLPRCNIRAIGIPLRE